jgi:hypothetical protein
LKEYPLFKPLPKESKKRKNRLQLMLASFGVGIASTVAVILGWLRLRRA